MSQTVTLEDAVQYTAVSDIYTAPDGGTVLYQTHSPVLADNGYEDQEWIRTPEGTAPFDLIKGAPHWTSADTFWYAVSAGRYETVIYRYQGGTRNKVTTVPFKAEVAAVLSGDRILLKARVNIAEKHRIENLRGETIGQLRARIAQEESDYMVMNEFPYWRDGMGITDRIRNLLYLYDPEEGLRQLTRDWFDVTGVVADTENGILYVTGAAYDAARPLGTELLRLEVDRAPAVTAEEPDVDGLERIPAEGHRIQEMVYDAVHGRLVFAGSVPDEEGTDLYTWNPATGEFARLARLEMAENAGALAASAEESAGNAGVLRESTGEPAEKTGVLTESTEEPVEDAGTLHESMREISYGASVLTDVLLGGSRSLRIHQGQPYFLGTWRETVKVYTVDGAGYVRPAVDSNAAIVVHDYAVSDAGIDYSALRGLQHLELYRQDPEGSTTRITAYNEAHWQDKRLSVPERLSYRDRYGFDIVGYVLRPIDPVEGQRYPAILDIHGGPADAYGPIFSHEMQYWAAHGYYVFWCNPTGSTGGGRAFSGIIGGTGGSDYEDIMGFTDLVLSRYPEIDPERIGVTGGSYGGFMTNWILGHTGRFAAAASGRSTANNITEAANKDIAPHFLRSMTEPDAPDRFERLWELSPLKYIDKSITRTPTIFLHSLEDYRCYHVESLQMYAALQYIGIPTRMILFRNESHGLSRCGHPRNRLRRLREITAWMDRYLNPDREHVLVEN